MSSPSPDPGNGVNRDTRRPTIRDAVVRSAGHAVRRAAGYGDGEGDTWSSGTAAP